MAALFLWRFGDHVAYMVTSPRKYIVPAEILATIAGFVLMAALAPVWALSRANKPVDAST